MNMLDLKPNLKQKRLSPELRREQLLAYAMMCYADLGVMRAGHGDVAKRANVSTATVFNYFPTRSALTQAVFQEVYNVFDKMFDAFPIQPQHIGSVGFLSAAYEFLVLENPEAAKVVLNWSASFNEEVRPAYLKFQSWLLSGIHSRLDPPRENMSDARIIMASAYGYTRMKLDGAEQEVLDRFTARVLSALSEDLN